MLDRRRGPDPPRLLWSTRARRRSRGRPTCICALRSGTNLALMNGLLRELIERGWIDEAYVAAHTLGFDALARDRRAVHAGARRGDLRRGRARLAAAAELLGTGERLLSTVLQGFYQSNQATAAACQVNNLHLLRGMLGRPGAGLCQMNGQPTAQNTRETGADGDLPGLRNWDNPAHVARARRAVERRPDDDPALGAADPRDADLPLRRTGLDRAAVDLARPTRPSRCPTRADPADPARDELFVVVQDLFLTETAAFADVVLPAATWGEKTGTFTNADRTVHLSDQAVDPPGEARPDLDIFLDYARRMDFRDRDGEPLINWHDPESRVRGVEGVLARAAPATTPGSPTSGCAAATASSGPAPTAPTAPSGCTPTASSTPTRTTARTTATTCAPARRSARTSTGQAAGRPRVPARRRLRAVTGDAERRVPAAADHRPHALPVPHPHEDRPRAELDGPRPGRLGRAQRRRRRTRSASRRATWSRVASPRGAIEAPARSTPPARRRLRAVPLRLLGRRRAGHARGGERADHHHLGPGAPSSQCSSRRRPSRVGERRG